MAEETTQTTGTEETNGQSTDVVKEFQAITSQEDFDKAIQARIARERAKIPGDYEDLKAKASEFEKWQESQKTEAQKQADRLAEIERENATLKVAKLRAEVAEAKSDPTKGIVIPASLLSGSTQEELETAADALIAFRGDVPKGPIIPGQGKQPNSTTAASPAQAFGDFLTNRLNS